MREIMLDIATADAMVRLGETVARHLAPGEKVLLIGPLGAGKTTLVKGIARGLGYEGRVTSPTFTLMNIYQGTLPVYHLDFYRLEEGEMPEEEWDEPVYGDGVTVMEWPQYQGNPDQVVTIAIDITDDDYDKPRRVRIKVPSARIEMLEGLNHFVTIEH